MAVHPSGFYAWRRNALSKQARDDQRLLGLIKHAWLESGGVYGYRKIHQDLRETGETCGKHRVGRLMRRERLRSQTGYRRRPGAYGSKPAVVSPNRLDRRFDVTAPSVAWVTDITYIRTHEGWLYLSVVIDLFSRQAVGWSMKPRMTTDLALDTLLSAVWRRKPQGVVIVLSDQGSQFSSADWQSFLVANHLERSMSRRGNCHDKAVAESFSQLLKQERIKRRIYSPRKPPGAMCSTISVLQPDAPSQHERWLVTRRVRTALSPEPDGCLEYPGNSPSYLLPYTRNHHNSARIGIDILRQEPHG